MKIAAFLSAMMCSLILIGSAMARGEAKLDLPVQCLVSGKILCISKTDRKLRFLQNGKVLMTLDARFGDSRTEVRYHTVEGMFKVEYREENSWSKKFKVNLPFSLYFYGHDQAIHYSDAFVRDGYGGSSHGCVNIRDYNKLRWLFNRVSVGTPVYIYA
jgi:L,D-transpeptidase catalytic domain